MQSSQNSTTASRASVSWPTSACSWRSSERRLPIDWYSPCAKSTRAVLKASVSLPAVQKTGR